MSTKNKLKEYQVQLINTEYGWVEVEAKDEDEARVKAEELVFKGEAHWVNSELKTDTVFDGGMCETCTNERHR